MASQPGTTLGGFTFTVGGNVQNAAQSLLDLQRAAQNTERILKVTLSAKAAIDSTQLNKELEEINKKLHELRQLTGQDWVAEIDTETARKDITSLQELIEGATRGAFRGLDLGSGVPIGAGFGLAAAGAALAASAVEALAGAIKSVIESSIAYNARMERMQTQFKVFAGNAQEAAAAMEMLRKYADITPFNTEEVMESGQVFMRVARGSQTEMMKLVEAAGQLAAINPTQGLSGATFAIQELLAGQSESIANRFNVSRTAIQRFKEEGLTGVALVQRVIQDAGGSIELVNELGQTFEGRMSTIKSILQDVSAAGFKPLFDAISRMAGTFAAFLQNNQKDIKLWSQVLLSPITNVINLFELLIKSIEVTDLLLRRLPQDAISTLMSGPKSTTQQGAGAKPKTGIDADPAYQNAIANLQNIEGQLVRNKRELDENALAVKVINKETSDLHYQTVKIQQDYEDQNRALERQIAILGKVNVGREMLMAMARGGMAEENLKIENAQAPIGMRADAASQAVTLGVENQLLDIQTKRVELAHEVQDINSRGRSVLEEQVRSAQKGVQAIQQQNQANSAMRQETMQRLQDEQAAESRLRQDRSDALQERLSGEQEAREVALRGIRDVIAAEGQRRAAEAQAAAEAREDDDALYANRLRGIERAHQAEMLAYSDRVQAIQDAMASEKTFGDTRTEAALRALDNEQRIAAQRSAIRNAERAVNTAQTITGQIEAMARLQDIKQQQDFENRKYALQERNRKEEEAQKKRDFEAQQAIAKIQAEQRQAQRIYDQESLSRTIQREDEMEARRLSDRAAEHAEQAIRKEEESKIRAQEEINRAADIAAAAETRALKAADLAEERAAKDVMNALQQQQRAEEKADQQALQAAQASAQALQEAAEEAAYQKNLARQQELDKIRMNAITNESKLLDTQQRLLDAQNTPAIAAAEGTKARWQQVLEIAGYEKQIEDSQNAQLIIPLQAQLFKNKMEESGRMEYALTTLGAYKLQLAELDKIKGALEAQSGILDKSLDKAKDAADAIAKAFTAKMAAEGKNADGTAKTYTPAQLLDDLGKFASEMTLKAAEWANSIITGFSEEIEKDRRMTKAIQDSQIAAQEAAKLVWDARSPSMWMVRFAGDIAQGFVDGINAQAPAVGTAMFNMFNNAWAAYASPVWDNADGILAQINTRMATIPTNIAMYDELIGNALANPYHHFVVTVGPSYNEHFRGIGSKFADNWIVGWQGNDKVETSIERTFDNVIYSTMPLFTNAFQTWGSNFAVAFQNGWAQTMANWRPFASPANAVAPGGQAPAGQHLDARASGGDVFPGRSYKLNEGMQYGEFYATGKIIPPEAFAREVAGALGGMGGRGGNIQVTVSDGAVRVTGNVDEAGLAQRIGQRVARSIADVVTDAQRNSPSPVDRILPGGA